MFSHDCYVIQWDVKVPTHKNVGSFYSPRRHADVILGLCETINTMWSLVVGIPKTKQVTIPGLRLWLWQQLGPFLLSSSLLFSMSFVYRGSWDHLVMWQSHPIILLLVPQVSCSCPYLPAGSQSLVTRCVSLPPSLPISHHSSLIPPELFLAEKIT